MTTYSDLSWLQSGSIKTSIRINQDLKPNQSRFQSESIKTFYPDLSWLQSGSIKTSIRINQDFTPDQSWLLIQIYHDFNPDQSCLLIQIYHVFNPSHIRLKSGSIKISIRINHEYSFRFIMNLIPINQDFNPDQSCLLIQIYHVFNSDQIRLKSGSIKT